MATNQTDFRKAIQENLAFGEVLFNKSASEEDIEQGIDAWVGGIPFAWRKRRISIERYGEISIRCGLPSKGRTEIDKLLAGECKALIYVFQFTDAAVVCLTEDIINVLERGDFVEKRNPDGSSAAYIRLVDIQHLLVITEGANATLAQAPQ